MSNWRCRSYSFNHFNLLKMKDLKCFNDDAFACRKNVENLKKSFWENFDNWRNRKSRLLAERQQTTTK